MHGEEDWMRGLTSAGSFDRLRNSKIHNLYSFYLIHIYFSPSWFQSSVALSCHAFHTKFSMPTDFHRAPHSNMKFVQLKCNRKDIAFVETRNRPTCMCKNFKSSPLKVIVAVIHCVSWLKQISLFSRSLSEYRILIR